MDWLIPDTPRRLAEMVAERAEGGGSLLATGAPAPASEARRTPDAEAATVFSTAGLDGGIDLRPRDLTVAAGAGVRIPKLQRALAEEGLWLAVGGTAGARSVGGAVAAASPGPWDRSYGDLRRQLLACRLVTWKGTGARWGRAVMKDVAGYGTVRAVAGSFGRLGIVHRAVFRVWPEPAVRAAITLEPEAADPLTVATRLAAADVETRVRPHVLRWRVDRTGGEDDQGLSAWLVGSPASVEARAERMEEAAAEIGAATEVSERSPEPAEGRPGSAGADRPLDLSVVHLRPGRASFEQVARGTLDALGESAVSAAGYPLAGALRFAYRRPGRDADGEGAGDGGPLGRLLEAVPDVPVAVERGSADELAAVRVRRPGEARRLERRVLDALEGRPRHWLSAYL